MVTKRPNYLSNFILKTFIILNSEFIVALKPWNINRGFKSIYA